MTRILFIKANVRGHMRGGKFVNAYTTKTPAAKKKVVAVHQGALFDGAKAAKPQPKAYHPKKGEKGEAVGIHDPHEPTHKESWVDPAQVATFTPGSPVPAELHGVPFKPWDDHPRTDDGWDYVDGQLDDLEEPPMHLPKGKNAASGVIVEEPDGRIWLVHPTNGFAGYEATFPKGGAEDELSLQANAIKEAFEESGLKVEITGYFGDFERGTTVARYYRARRVGGTPAAMGWESQAVSLVPKDKLFDLLNGWADKPVAMAAGAVPEGYHAIESADAWEKVGQQGGSNPGGYFEDEAGREWYCKFPKSSDHAKNEILASKLYEALGIRTPHMKLIRRGGQIGVASGIIHGLAKNAAALKSGKAKGAADGFAADAWLANWDSVGLLYDNMLVDEDGNAVRLDPGGSLLFRAQGAPKGAAFGTKVDEVDTLRSGKNVQAAEVFGKLTKKDIAKGVAKIAALPDAAITALVLEHGPGSAKERQALADKLVARKADLMKRFPG